MRARNQVRRRPRVPRKPRAKTTTTALVKAVAKKVVADALEDKYVTATYLPSGFPGYFNASISGNNEIYFCLPNVSQGTGSNQRIGDTIRPKRLRVDFVLTANGSYNSSQLNQVRLFVLQDKAIRDIQKLRDTIVPPNIGTPISKELLDVGGSVSGWSGVPNDIMKRVNRQRYTVYKDKAFELIAGTGQTPQPGNGYNGTQTFVSPQQCWRCSVVIPTPAVLKYSNALDDFPTNFAPFFCVGYTQPDGNASPDNILTRLAVNWVVHMDFEDA